LVEHSAVLAIFMDMNVKLTLFGLCCFININVFAQTSKNVLFLDRWHQDTLVTNSSQVRYSGCWGFTFGDQEYAAIGSTEGTHFFEITTNNKLRSIGSIEGRFNSSQVIHRELKTYKQYAYAICDEGNSSLQIIDLQYLPDSVVKVADIQDERFGKVHNLFIDTSNALLYACLVTPIVNGQPQSLIPLRVFSIENPLDPQLLWEGPQDIYEVHDCYVRNNIAFLNCGQEGMRIYDFSLPSNPINLNNIPFYQDQGYNHQGWLSPSGKTYVFADETTGKRVKKCTYNSENHQLSIDVLFGTENYADAVPHNIVCTDNWAFVAYYNEGLRIYDIRNAPREIAFYDTYNQSSFFNMNGAWGVFPFSSGRVIVSDRQNGLFLLNFDEDPLITLAAGDFQLYPNPVIANESFTVRTKNDDISLFDVSILDNNGKIVSKTAINGFTYLSLQSPISPGLYTVEINYTNYLNEPERVVLKLAVL
jgi:choice-of-anchor B domain-containing protein